jgi:hypothetical protein
VQSGALVSMRLQVEQSGGTTELRAELWPHGAVEPVGWALDIEDSSAALQNVAGAFAFDVYNYAGAGDDHLDDATITEL